MEEQELKNFDKVMGEIIKKINKEEGLEQDYTYLIPRNEYTWMYDGLPSIIWKTFEFSNFEDLLKEEIFNAYYKHLSIEKQGFFKKYIELYEYLPSNFVRGYRSKMKKFELATLVKLLCLDTISFDIYDNIKGKEYFRYSNWQLKEIQRMYIMVLLNDNDSEMLEFVKKMLYDNENILSFSEDIIIGIIMSDNEKAINCLIDLLKAAKLSEGLRSSILKWVDYGSIENYKIFLQIIKDENLIRFSSVKYEFTMYTGISQYNIDSKNYERQSQYVLDCMLDNKATEYLEDTNALKIYIALYSMATTDFDGVQKYIYDNIETAKVYKKSTMLYFLYKSSQKIDSKIILDILEGSYPENLKNMVLDFNVKFENECDKKNYIVVVLKYLTSVKKMAKYSIFSDEASLKVDCDSVYSYILQLVYETNYYYEEAYLYFDKYHVRIFGNYKEIKYEWFKKIYHPAQKNAYLRGLGSSANMVRLVCFKLIRCLDLKLTEDDYMEIAKLFKSKRSDVRVTLCELYKDATPEIILKCATYLLGERKVELKSGGLSILMDNIDRIIDVEGFEDVKKLVSNTEVAYQYEVLKNKILGLDDGSINEEEVKEEIVYDVPTLEYDMALVNKIAKFDIRQMNVLAENLYKKFMVHVGEEVDVVDYDGSKETLIIGTTMKYPDKLDIQQKCSEIAFQDELFEELKNLSYEDVVLSCMYYDIMIDRNYSLKVTANKRSKYFIEKGYIGDFLTTDTLTEDTLTKYYSHSCNSEKKCISATFDRTLSAYRKYLEQNMDNDSEAIAYNKLVFNWYAFMIENFKNQIDKLPEFFYYNDKTIYSEGGHIKERIFVEDPILEFVLDSPFDDKKYFDNKYACDVYKNILHLKTKSGPPILKYFDSSSDRMRDTYIANYHSKYLNDAYAYDIYKNTLQLKTKSGLPTLKYFNLLDNGISEKYIVENFTDDTGFNVLDLSRILNSWNKNNIQDKEVCIKVYNQCINILLEEELQRTDSKTSYSDSLAKCQIFYGVETFMKALDKMKKIDFVCIYSWNATSGIKDVFSNIARYTVPEENLTQEEFNKFVKQYNVSDKKLLEACMYNKNFIEFGANYLNIQGLHKAIYYFIAHGLSYDNDEDVKKNIRRYSDFEIEDFIDGRMDIKWFNEIQDEMSKEDYKKVYDASKFIMDTSKRKRAQYFADAVTGKLSLEEIESKINDTRNQDMLLCFGLVPLDVKNKDKEALRRYNKLQQFIRETKQFGSQRRVSETKRANVAIANLATNYGMEANSFVWVMEVLIADEAKAVFEPKQVGEVEVYLSLEDVTKPEIIVHKDGKKLKSLPAKYKKDEYILHINDVKKELKNQYARARVTLEQNMVDSKDFDFEEIDSINTHPVIKEIIKDLLFINDGFIGLIKGDKLVDFEGKEQKLTKKSKVRIAHVVDLYKNNWDKWQIFMMNKGIKQPFKQVFRELYTLTDDEIQNDGYTNRFAGYQISVRQAYGVLCSRNWIVNEYYGFEKINHAQNLRIDLYCYANWANANDLEAETLERVEFLDNKTNKTKDMKTLDPILFSETMRDLDLVVSVAYVGGVDPLLNHTTLEMRKRILEHNLKLFKITNYTFTNKHINITGEHGNYSIHLGSGIVSMQGKGMLPVFPVHSQQRGHIFLPFVDEDPKTSEIITKVLMFAKDNKIKDPTILKHLR